MENKNIKEESSVDHLSDRSKLASLYPRAKSFDELQQEREESKARWAKRLPQHIIISTAIRIYLVMATAFIIISSVPNLVAWNLMSGVFASFLLALFWVGFSYSQFKLISTALQQTGIGTATFFVPYTLSLISILITCSKLSSTLDLQLTPTVLFLVMSTISHFILVGLFIAIIRINKFSNSQKIFILCITVLICIIPGIMSGPIGQ